MKYVGKACLKSKILHTKYFWGPITDLECKVLPVLERNKDKACLCIVFDGDVAKGLVDVHPNDILIYIPMEIINEINGTVDLLDLFTKSPATIAERLAAMAKNWRF